MRLAPHHHLELQVVALELLDGRLLRRQPQVQLREGLAKTIDYFERLLREKKT